MDSISDPSNSAASPNSATAMPSAPTLRPTWHGYIGDTRDALILFEASITGQLNRVVRRPHDRERSSLIKSGSVFVYEESASGIKRWTDGVPWSPSRILNNFLIYRELEKPFPPGEKKRATKKARRDPRPGDPYARPISNDELRASTSPPATIATTSSPLSITSTTLPNDVSADRDAERLLVGSLTDSYQFKLGGLVKKTMSVKVEEVSYHLVSYYTPEDVKAGVLPRPADQMPLRDIDVRPELLHRQNFRAPLDELQQQQQQEQQQSEHSPQGGYRVQGSNTYGSPASMSYGPSPSYMAQATSMAQTTSYYSTGMAAQYQMQSPPLQHHGYFTSPGSRLPIPVTTTSDGYYSTMAAPTAEHHSSYADPRQQSYNPRSLSYSNHHLHNNWHDPPV